MADLVVTASQVQPGANAVIQTVTASVAITAGQAVYKTTAGLLALADANVTVTESRAFGIACSTASGANQPCAVVTEGDIIMGAGAAPAAGQPYCVSDAAGGISPDADVLATEWYTLLGIGIGSNTIRLSIIATGVQHA